MGSDGWPLRSEDAVDAGVTQGSIGGVDVVAEDAIELCPEALDGGAASCVERVGAEFDGGAAECVEGVAEE